MPSQEYKYLLSGTAPELFPTDTFFALLYCSKDDVLGIPKRIPFSGIWGEPTTTHLMNREDYPVPQMLDIVWLSIIERKFYSLTVKLSTDIFESNLKDIINVNKDDFTYVVLGMAPYGGLALWVYSPIKSLLTQWMNAEEIDVSMKDFQPQCTFSNVDDYCNKDFKDYIKAYKENYNNILPPRNLFDNYMKQFTYRYVVVFEKWNDDDEKWMKHEEEDVLPEFEHIDEKLYDGTHDKLHDGGLMKYHEAGKPKKLTIKWHIKKSEYSAFFWFDEKGIRTVFDKFYGAHPDTKSDFMIKIDPDKRKYELSLYRYGLKETVTIPEEAYQQIVFKNKFEDYRSDNYSQESGAWIW